MKFAINLSGKTLYTFMRQAGYTPEKELAFHRFLGGHEYPKFHVYATPGTDKKSAMLNLHLDQKKPSYKGFHAHNAEYDGSLVEAETIRIRNLSAH